MNWIWFRKHGAYLSDRIVRRSSSWLDLNPGIQFHLWTDLENEEEAIDFFSGNIEDPELKSQRENYRKRLIVHYRKETWDVAKEFCEENSTILKGENLWEIYREILDNKEDKAAMIFKTDILRCMILYQRGGWYSDYNDTFCFVPLKYVINQEKRDLIYLGCDIYSNHNNYIMYSPKYHSKWLDLTTQIVVGGVNTYKMLKKTLNYKKNKEKCIYVD
jgi:mannosyltransferase OCH1-like enzyme